ncbi:hypothetical protein [Mameliella sp.]|uniref:hypothetical protein n=1 Tax=Mameliella sp. TaxID=1924940 RepID=UPI003B5031D9
MQANSAGVVVDHPLGEVPPADWAGTFDQLVFVGNRITTEVDFFQRPSGTTIFTHLLQQLPEGMNRGWRAVVARAFDWARCAQRALRSSFVNLPAAPSAPLALKTGSRPRSGAF